MRTIARAETLGPAEPIAAKGNPFIDKRCRGLAGRAQAERAAEADETRIAREPRGRESIHATAPMDASERSSSLSGLSSAAGESAGRRRFSQTG